MEIKLIDQKCEFFTYRFLGNKWLTQKVVYDKVFWYEGFKYCLGQRTDFPQIRWVFEMSSCASCAPKVVDAGKVKYTDEGLVQHFIDRKTKENANIGRLVEEFHAKIPLIVPLWKTSILFQ